MSDSTPTAVTVSDRMRQLVNGAVCSAQLLGTIRDDADAQRLINANKEHSDSLNALLREIGKLEDMLVDQGSLAQPSSAFDEDGEGIIYEATAEDIAALKRLIPPHPDPAEERLEESDHRFVCGRCGKELSFGKACTCLPQTLEEEIPLKVNCAQCGKILTGPPFIAEQDVSFCRIQCAEEYGTVPTTSSQALPQPFVSEEMAKLIEEYAVAVAECGWEHQKEVGDADAHSATAKARLYDLMDGIARLEQDRSRLLTALEEEKQAWLELHVERDNLRLECERLTAASVLQKEELDRQDTDKRRDAFDQGAEWQSKRPHYNSISVMDECIKRFPTSRA